MNKVYRIVRNVSTGKLVVASELAKGRKGSVAACAAALMLLPLSAGAATVNLPDFNPTDNEYDSVSGRYVGAYASPGGGNDTVTRPKNIASGTNAQGMTTLQTLLDEGRILSGQELIGMPRIQIGTQSKNILIPDSATGGNKTALVYDSSAMSELAAFSPGMAVVDVLPVSDKQYLNTRFATASGQNVYFQNPDGGSLNHDPFSTANAVTMAAKQSSLLYADGTANQNSTISYMASTYFKFNALPVNLEPGQTYGTLTTTGAGFTKFGGTFAAFDGSAHTVTNASELAAYNNWLIDRLKDGSLSSNDYLAEFKRGADVSAGGIKYKISAESPDEGAAPLGNVVVIHAKGANAVGRVIGYSELYTNGTIGGAMLAEDGATIENMGTLGYLREVATGDGVSMRVDSGSHGVNKGVLNSNIALDAAGRTISTGLFRTLGAVVQGSSTFENEGIINLASGRSTGGSGTGSAVYVESGSADNSGVINVGVGGSAGDGGLEGATVVGGTFTNSAGGTIYVGRGAQNDPSVVAQDVEFNPVGDAIGIRASGTGSAVNNGTITIGSLTQHAIGMDAQRSDARVENQGTINILGAVTNGVPKENIGLRATGGTVAAVNSGTINVGDVGKTVINATGIKALAASKVISSGVVNVNGSVDVGTGIRNYGVWAQGVGSQVALDGGAVNLAGVGGIGIRADKGGKVDVDGATVNFLEGSRQIGLFAYGAGSSINILSTPAAGFDVSTQDSTLIRVEDGAVLNNSVSAPLTASGEGSTAIQVTGVGSVANLSNMDITVSGTDAVALRVEGGATGSMDGVAHLRLKDGTTGVVVDDVKYDLAGNPVGKGASKFANTADVSVLDARDVTAFLVKNGGELMNSGQIHLAHGTGIELDGPDTSMVSAPGGGKITIDDGVAGIYVHNGATATSSDDITVNNAAAGVLIGPDAGPVVLTNSAHITGMGAGYGTLVFNEGIAANALVDGSLLEMQGTGAALLGNNNLNPSSHGRILVSSQVGGKGIAVSNDDGSRASGSATVGDDWDIDVTGNGAGVYANTSGDITIDSRLIDVSGAGNAIKADAAGALTLSSSSEIVGTNGDAKLVVGNINYLATRGTLRALQTDAVAIELGDGATVMENSGAIQGQVLLGGGADCLRNEGTIDGSVDLGGGDDCASVVGGNVSGPLSGGEGNDTITLDGAIMRGVTGGAGADVITLQGPKTSTFVSLDGGLGNESDRLVLDGYIHVLDRADELENFESISLVNSSTFDLRNSLALGDSDAGVGQMDVQSGSELLATHGPVSLGGNLLNGGLVSMANGAAGDSLSVAGDYVGGGGTVAIDTVLGDDSSPTDRLIVRGSTSGATAITVRNAGGSGSYTTGSGIKVVEVAGASDGSFTLNGRVVAGANEYLLAKGSRNGPADGNWYLRSEVPAILEPSVPEQPKEVEPPVVIPPPPVEPPAVEEPPQSEQQPSMPVYRPEVGAYLANQAAAMSMFEHTMHDRLGEVDYDERQREDQVDGRGSVWSRVTRDQLDSKAGADQLAIGTDTSVVHIGTELGRWTEDDSRFNFGLMGGIGQSNTKVVSDVTSYQAKGKVKGYNLGVYGTWFANASEATGLYVDGWLQYGRYESAVEGLGMSRESYDARGWTGSVEAGYAVEFGRGDNSAWYLEPQAQAIYSAYESDTHTEENGTMVDSKGGDGLTTRLGVRLYSRPLEASANKVQPFIQADWWHMREAQSIGFNSDIQSLASPGDRYEVKAGVEAELGGGWTGWGHLSIGAFEGEGRSIGGLLGLKYGW